MFQCDAIGGHSRAPCHCESPPGLSRRGLLASAMALGTAARVMPAAAQTTPAQPASAQPAPAQPAQFRIDVHHHYTSPALLAMMKGRRTHQTFNEQWTVEKSLQAMEKGGVAKAVLSTSDPGVWFGDFDAAAGLARDCNDYQARLIADHPGRFGMFTTVPLPDVELAQKEVAYGFDVLKAHGVGVMTSYAGKYLGDPSFAPLMADLNRRRAVVFVHPLGSACCSNLLPGVPDQVVEYNSETSRTIASLIFSGTLGRFPDIRFIFSHGGGTVPYLVARFERLFNSRPDIQAMSQDGCVALLRKLYFDTAQAFNEFTLASLTRLMPTEHILYGSDFPAAQPDATSKGLADFGMTAAQQQAIGRDNAVALMPALA
jgi:predicted TIM-barrel fold metal-dependent hydrolase